MQRWKEIKKHEAKIGQVTTFYTFVFDLGRDKEPVEFAKNLLRHQVAETVVSPANGEVRVSPRYSELSQTQDQAEDLISVDEFLSGERKFFSLSWRSRYLVAKFHAVFLFSKVFSQKGESAPPEDRSDIAIKSKMKEIISDIDDSVSERRTICALLDAIDKNHYEMGYLLSEPHIRLELRAFRARLALKLPGIDPDDEVVPTVTLMLHRSGVALLTFGVRLPHSLPTGKVVPFINSASVEFNRTTIPEPMLRGMISYRKEKEHVLSGEWLGEIEEGTRWRQVAHMDEPANLMDVFHVYRDAIVHYARGSDSYGDYMCSKTIFLETLNCCGTKRLWMRRHWRELASLLSRSDLSDSLSKTVQASLIGRDFSLTSERSLFIPGGAITEVNWNFSDESNRTAKNYYDRVALNENGLLRYWSLRTLDDEIKRTDTSRRGFEKLLASAVPLINESSKSHLSYSGAKEISDHIVKESGGPEVLYSVNNGIALLKDLVSSKESARTNRRTNQFAAVAMLAAIFLGLPAIKQSIDVLKSVPTSNIFGRLAANFVGLASSTDALALYSYLILLLLGILVLTVGRIAFSIKRKRAERGSMLGIKWRDGRSNSQGQAK